MSKSRTDLILRHELIEEVFDEYGSRLGRLRDGLYGHAYRSLNYCLHIAPGDADRLHRFAIVAAFHDLPAAMLRDLEYFEPAKTLTAKYLHGIGRPDWQPAVAAMIDNHHKLTTYCGPYAGEVEAVRQADWLDAALGLRRFEVDPELRRRLNREWPPWNLIRPALGVICGYAIRHPLHPLPMMRW